MNLDKKFEVGDCVITPQGYGKVSHWRFGAPDYTHVVAYSVILDIKKDQYGYSGTIFPANQVAPHNE